MYNKDTDFFQSASLCITSSHFHLQATFAWSCSPLNLNVAENIAHMPSWVELALHFNLEAVLTKWKELCIAQDHPSTFVEGVLRMKQGEKLCPIFQFVPTYWMNSSPQIPTLILITVVSIFFLVIVWVLQAKKQLPLIRILSPLVEDKMKLKGLLGGLLVYNWSSFLNFGLHNGGAWLRMSSGALRIRHGCLNKKQWFSPERNSTTGLALVSRLKTERFPQSWIVQAKWSSSQYFDRIASGHPRFLRRL